jgi:iron complex transport system permease protein
MTAQPETAASSSTADRPPILLALAGLLWMAGLLWSARATITGGADAEMEVTSTAYALPGATSASLVAGAAAALAVLIAVGRFRTPGPTIRFAIATGTGLVLGLLGALVIITINTDGWIYAVVGGTIAAAATIGGALAGLRSPRVLSAICWAAIAVFVVGFVVNYLPVLDIFGRGGAGSAAAAAQVASAGWFSLVQAVVSGLAAGLVAYRSLRRASRPFSWPLYALAGAGPGLLLVLAEVLARTAGARVLDLAGKVSELELTVQQTLSTSRLDSALIVLFVGAVTAIIAIGRTIKPDPPAQ